MIENHYYSVKSGKPVSGLGDGYPDRPLKVELSIPDRTKWDGKGIES
jgi:hypothetical protein